MSVPMVGKTYRFEMGWLRVRFTFDSPSQGTFVGTITEVPDDVVAPDAVPGLTGFSWEPQRVAAQGDLVFTHAVVHGGAPGPVAIVDVFRLRDGRIVEHWDVVQDLVPPGSTTGGRPMA